jgi:hypothetical protein
MDQPSVSSEIKLKEAFDLYESGKHRRYSLLFSVNGGAFAIAKLLNGGPGSSGLVIGELTLTQLSIGLAAFSAVMVWDIWLFGEKMRLNYLKGAFGHQGKIVLLLIGGLIVSGWLLAGLPRPAGA